ncbi:MAG: acetoacetate--CoA ligase [Gemmatimonadaceae bacterium]
MRDEHVPDRPLWEPSPERASRTQLVAFAQAMERETGRQFLSPDGKLGYDSLWQWSVEDPAAFWEAWWRWADLVGDPTDAGRPYDDVVVGLNRMAPPDATLGPRWFPGARLNFAEHLLRYRDDQEAVVSWNELGRHTSFTYAELSLRVGAVARALAAEGVGVGDRVAAFMPNIAEAVVGMLATASLGAIWSSCSPDFGVKGVLDRFGQIAPKVMFAADGYVYAGKRQDCLARVREIAAAIPEIQRVVVVRYLGGLTEAAGTSTAVAKPPVEGVAKGALTTEPLPVGAMWWTEWIERSLSAKRGAPPEKKDSAASVHPSHPFIASRTESPRGPDDTSSSVSTPSFRRLPFDHPLYIMYSSGTTGLPKCMVHGAGGTLLQHLKEHRLHVDLRRADRIFYFTTCGWMMWNWLVSALAVGATLVLYDGAPLVPGPRTRAAGASPHLPPDILWELAEQERLTVFGTSAKYLALAEKEGLKPAQTHDLGPLRAVLSTGSPLAPPSFDYVYRDIKRDVCLSSISGGTDIISCFALGNPAGPVWRGELQARGLGMAVDIFDADGKPLRGAPGELVCTRPFPSMPVAFWNDPDGALYRAAYFQQYPGVWRHGDWAELTSHGGLVITGRSDATLNPGGVRIGTAELYRQVEQLPEIVESLVIGQEIGHGAGADVRIVLFVRLRAGERLDDALRDRIRRQIREHTSPHHVPKVIVQVADIPRTISGKITELAVRDVIHGRPVKNVDAMANPEALRLFEGLEELKE